MAEARGAVGSRRCGEPVEVLGALVAVGDHARRRPATAPVSASANIGGMTDAGALLFEARQRAGLSQAELARRAGIPRSVLNAYERGRRQPGADTFLRILDAADIEVRLSETTRRDMEERLGRILGQVLGLADALPLRREGPLEYPQFARRVG